MRFRSLLPLVHLRSLKSLTHNSWFLQFLLIVDLTLEVFCYEKEKRTMKPNKQSSTHLSGASTHCESHTGNGENIMSRRPEEKLWKIKKKFKNHEFLIIISKAKPRQGGRRKVKMKYESHLNWPKSSRTKGFIYIFREKHKKLLAKN